MFSNAALSRSQFCFDFLQNYRQESLTSSNVCYWKSAKSVDNFRSKKRTAFSKNRLFCFRACVGGPWFDPRFGQIFFNLNFSSCDREWFLLCEKHRKWLNILLTLWCSCISLLSSVNLLCDGYILIIAIFSFIKFNNCSSKTKNKFTWTSKQLSLISRQKLRTSEPQLKKTNKLFLYI